MVEMFNLLEISITNLATKPTKEKDKENEKGKKGNHLLKNSFTGNTCRLGRMELGLPS
jgi:hypothetical protein